MATRRDPTGSRQLRTLLHVGAVGELTDGDLLGRFAAGRVDGDEAAQLAFAVLVDRHASAVLRTCRAILGDEHEAQDALQATFLVLARKAGSIRVRDSLGPWLHRVASYAARTARSASARRRGLERRLAARPAGPGASGDRDDLGAALHEEIGRLPDRFRVPLLLCDLQGLTHEQAAADLGCPVGTIKSRLSRGRDRLKRRLIRRGLAPALAGLGATPGRLASAREVAAALAGAGASGSAPALAERTIHAMILGHGKTVAAALVVVGSVVTGASLLARQAPAPPAPPRVARDAPAAVAEGPLPSALEVLDRLKGRIDANRAAARSVALSGEARVVRTIFKPATDPAKSDEGSRRPAFDVKGRFSFVADESGRRKAWIKSYEPKGFCVDEARALDGDVVRDANDPNRGCLRTPREFLGDRSDNLDFYRDHWAGADDDPILGFATIRGIVRDSPGDFTTRRGPGGAIRIVAKPRDGRAARDMIEVAPAGSGMFRAEFFTDQESQGPRWTWAQDPASRIWYPSQLVRSYRLVYPDGTDASEEMTLVVTEARFNEPIPPATFTFDGLGLRPGTPISDMRNTAP